MSSSDIASSTEDLNADPSVKAQPVLRSGWHWTTFLVGLGAGLLNGLLGIGGGIIIVPGLIFLRNLTPRPAVATSLGTVLVLATGALAVHVAISGYQISWLGSLLVFVAGGISAQGGAWLLKRMSPRGSFIGFSIIALAASFNLISQGLGLYTLGGLGGGTPPLWSYIIVGIITGLASGVLGIGGGGLVTLFFAAVFQVPIVDILPLALAVNVVNAGSGVVGQWREGSVHWREVFYMVPSSVLGIGLGVQFALVLPTPVLKVIFGLFFVYLGVRMVIRSFQAKGALGRA